MWAQQEKKKKKKQKKRVADTQNVIGGVQKTSCWWKFDTMEYLPHESINKKTLNGKSRPIVLETRAAAVSLREQGVGEKNPA